MPNAIERQVSEASKLESDQKKWSDNRYMMDEVNKLRAEEREMASRVEKAGPDYGAEWKKAGGAAVEKDAKGEVTGFDFGKGGDIYGDGGAAPGKDVAESKPKAAPKSESGDLVQKGVEEAKKSTAEGGDSVAKAEKIAGV